jgi:nucleoside-diphosphate-sugar epimerase
MQHTGGIGISAGQEEAAMGSPAVLLTGGRSRLCRALVVALAACDASLKFIIASGDPESTVALYPAEIAGRVRFTGYSLAPLVSEAIKAIFHLGWRRESPTPATAAGDILFTEEVAKLARACQVKTVVFGSTQAVYSTALENLPDESVLPFPEGVYGLSKVAGERIIGSLVDRVPGCRVVIARISRVIGPEPDVRWSNTVHRVVQDVAMGNQVTLQGVAPAYDLIDVRDVIDALISMYDTPLGSGEHIFNIGSGVRVSWLDVISSTGDLLGRDVSGQISISPGSDSRRFGVTIEKAKRELKWQPRYALVDTIRDLLGLLPK